MADPRPVEAISYCAERALDPAQVLLTQFLITAERDLHHSAWQVLELQSVSIYYGEKAAVVPMHDAAGRLFGAFIGVGVDSEGTLITPGCFSRFDITAPEFIRAFDHYVAYIAGRYLVVLDTPATTQCYFDPVAHMTAVYNPRLRRLASSVQLALDRTIEPNPMFDTEAILGGSARGETEPNYILGHSRDREVRFVLPNHVLDLRSFTLTRIWPLADSFPLAPEEEFETLTASMVTRLSQILSALVNTTPSILPVSGGTDSRKLLACLSSELGQVGQLFAFEHTEYAKLDAVTGEYAVSLLDAPFRRIGLAEAQATFTPSAIEQRQRKRQFWLRTSGVARPPNEYAHGMTEMTPEDHLHLRGNIMDLMWSIWWRSFANRHERLETGLRNEIGSLFLNPEPSREMVEKWASDYLRWRHALPENAQELVYDFVFLELFLHVSSAKYYGYDRNFYICPFADRKLIETTLRFPVGYRFDNHLNERFIAIAEPRLADQPYRGGVRKLIASGAFTPQA